MVGVFPSMVCKIIGATESACGLLEAMLVKAAKFYDEEIDRIVEKIGAVIETTSLVLCQS